MEQINSNQNQTKREHNNNHDQNKQQYEGERGRKNTQFFFIQFGPIMTCSRGESNSSTNQESNFTKIFQKKLQESVFKPNSTFSWISSCDQETLWCESNDDSPNPKALTKGKPKNSLWTLDLVLAAKPLLFTFAKKRKQIFIYTIVPLSVGAALGHNYTSGHKNATPRHKIAAVNIKKKTYIILC